MSSKFEEQERNKDLRLVKQSEERNPPGFSYSWPWLAAMDHKNRAKVRGTSLIKIVTTISGEIRCMIWCRTCSKATFRRCASGDEFRYKKKVRNTRRWNFSWQFCKSLLEMLVIAGDPYSIIGRIRILYKWQVCDAPALLNYYSLFNLRHSWFIEHPSSCVLVSIAQPIKYL